MKDLTLEEKVICRFDELQDPGCKEFHVGEGEWPFKGFLVRKGSEVFAYQNFCMHVGHPLNWRPDEFLTGDGDKIVCASHGALYEIESGVCVAGPCPGKTLRTVAVEVRNGDVVVKAPGSA